MVKTKLDALIHGSVAPGFEDVEAEFGKNFEKRGELGAACAVYYKGEKVVDLWGGYRDEKTHAPWQEDTMVLVFSSTKGLSALTLALAHSRGWLDYEQKVASYWPEFAQQGKENVTVRQLLGHQAGLCVIDEHIDAETLRDLDALAAIIAKQKPAWEPGTRQGYHTISMGFYEGELLRRIDPQHRSLGQFFHEEIARPLGLEFYIGLPASIPNERIATLKFFDLRNMLTGMGNMKLAMAFLDRKSLISRSFNNPSLGGVVDHTRAEYRGIEVPSANGTGTVRSMARAYSAFAMGGAELGVTKDTMNALTAAAVPPSLGSYDMVLQIDWLLSLGFARPSPLFPFAGSPKAFGTPGMGGSIGFADPDAQVGFAYAMNKLGMGQGSDPRQKALEEAFYRCLQR